MDYKQSANFEFTQTKKKKYILLELESEMDIFLMNLIIQITQYICKLYIIHKYNPVTFMLNMCPNTNMLLWGFFNFHIHMYLNIIFPTLCYLSDMRETMGMLLVWYKCTTSPEQG